MHPFNPARAAYEAATTAHQIASAKTSALWSAYRAASDEERKTARAADAAFDALMTSLEKVSA